MRSWGFRGRVFLGDPKIPIGAAGSPWSALEERERQRLREGGGFYRSP
jgi:hypothetical protein